MRGLPHGFPGFPGSRKAPEGNRIYQAIFVDGERKQTLSSYNAVDIIFDNRLDAWEIRKETDEFKIPLNRKDKIALRTSLNFLQYPGSFSHRFGLPKPELFEVATIRKEIDFQRNTLVRSTDVADILRISDHSFIPTMPAYEQVNA